MKVVYEIPINDNFEYKQRFDNDGKHEIWYKETTSLYDYQNKDIPIELKKILR